MYLFLNDITKCTTYFYVSSVSFIAYGIRFHFVFYIVITNVFLQLFLIYVIASNTHLSNLTL